MERGNKIKKWKWNASEGRCRNQHESTKVLALYTLIYCTCTVHLQVHLAVDPLEYRVSATNMQPMRMNDDGMRMKLCHSCVTECGQRAISICTVAYATHCYICVCFCGVPQESVPHDGRVQESSSPFACVITLAFAICQWMMQLISVQFCTLCKEKSKLSPTQAASCDRPTFVLRFTFCKPENDFFRSRKKSKELFNITEIYLWKYITLFLWLHDGYPNHAYHSDRRKDVASNKNTNFCPFHSRSFCDRLWVFVPILRNSIFCCLYLPTFRIFHAHSIFYGYENAAFHNIKIMYDGLF